MGSVACKCCAMSSPGDDDVKERSVSSLDTIMLSFIYLGNWRNSTVDYLQYMSPLSEIALVPSIKLAQKCPVSWLKYLFSSLLSLNFWSHSTSEVIRIMFPVPPCNTPWSSWKMSLLSLFNQFWLGTPNFIHRIWPSIYEWTCSSFPTWVIWLPCFRFSLGLHSHLGVWPCYIFWAYSHHYLVLGKLSTLLCCLASNTEVALKNQSIIR